ncbi:hypothetical protein [Porphyromonas endodontalis]|uniref:tetratricopeptide repeat protein n=1 Tax=Porphyromonas endodontalis TaxID=28124 RepID=UPI0028E5B96A|nr:hypothetical protein [Porphyromonas endodontalis]
MRTKTLTALLLWAGISLVSAVGLSAQSLQEARALREMGDWASAESAYSMLVEQSPLNTALKEEYASLLLEVGKSREALDLLLSHSNKKSRPSASLLAQAYYANYLFEETLTTLGRLSPKAETPELATLRQQAQRARQMLDKSERLEIVDSMQMDLNALPVLPKQYFSTEWGRLRSASDFRSEVGQFNAEGWVYETALGLESFYARKLEHRGDSDIFSVLKLQGRMAEENPLEAINTPNDECYPILRQDGITLIFARKSSEGIGGYDLYLSRRDPETGNYQTPSLLGMPFNSPQDDLFLIYDDLRGVGVLASTRFCPPGKVNLYTFRINEEHTLLPFNTLQEKRPAASLNPWRATAQNQ